MLMETFLIHSIRIITFLLSIPHLVIFAALLLKVLIVQKVHCFFIAILHLIANILQRTNSLSVSAIDLIAFWMQSFLFFLISIVECHLKCFSSIKFSKNGAMKFLGSLIFFSYLVYGSCSPLIRNRLGAKNSNKLTGKDEINSYHLINQNCTEYIEISFQLKYKHQKGFLTRPMIIRLNINHKEECKKDIEFINFAEMKAIQLPNSISNKIITQSVCDQFFILMFFISIFEFHLKHVSSMKFCQKKTKKFLGFFLFLSCVAYGSCSPIVRNLPVCKETNKSIDIDSVCGDTACVIYKNLLYQLSFQDDVFNYIYTADFKQVIVYSNKGRVYQTDCEIIQSFDLIVKQDCSKYVAIKFQLKYEQTIGYLSRQMIIRLNINPKETCENNNEEKDFGNFDKEFKLYKKGNSIGISGRNDTSKEIDFEEQNPVLEAYDNTFSSALPNLLRDIFLSIVGIFVYLAILYKIIINTRERNCLNISKKTINDSKKLCCWCKFGKTVEPTMEREPKFPQSALSTTASVNSFAPQVSTSSFAFPLASAPSFQDSNVYHTIGNNFPVNYNSTSSLYQTRMPTRSGSNIYIKEEPYGSNAGDTICPHCPQGPPPKWPKKCKGQVGLSLHLSKMHNIK